MEPELLAGEYQLVRKIEEDGMTEAWEGRHVSLDRRCFIKFLRPGFAEDWELQHQFLDSVRLQASLSHRNIVPILDVLEQDGRVYVVMPYIDGVSLEAVLDRRRGPLTLDEVRAISQDILSALEYAHSHGVIHRDVNPSSILIDERGRAYLTDFGIFREPKPPLIAMRIGTLNYSSPEPAAGRVDERSDVYSFGCVLYEMLSGHPPFDFKVVDERSLLARMAHEMPSPLRLTGQRVPDEVEAVVFRCLAKNPADRFQSSEAVLAALESALSGEKGRTLAPPPSQAPRSQAPMPPIEASPVRRRTLFAGLSPATEDAAALNKPSFDATLVRVFYATDRMQIPSLPGAVKYGRLRSVGGALHLGWCEVSIPKVHRTGKLETPSILRLEFRPNPEKHIVLTKTRSVREQEYVDLLRSSIAKSAAKDAFIFVHGYNVSFEDAARRTGQIAYDLDFVGAPIFYSWPSNGKIAAYLKDETNIAWSTPHFQRFLDMVACRSGAERIHVIAHSMGNRAVCEAIKALSLDTASRLKFNHLLLAAPDIDADTFQELAERLTQLCGRVTIYESSRDKALLASKAMHGNPRAGEPVLVVQGMDTIDATEVDTDFLGHSYFSDNRDLLVDMHALLSGDKPPSSRFGLTAREHASGRYWHLRP